MRYIAYNVKNSEEPSFDEIVNNIRDRTKRIRQYLKTSSGRKISRKHQRLITLFLNNYKDFS